MLREPFAHFRVFVSGVVVNDGIDPLSLGKMRVDVIEEADELLMPVALHVATDNGAVENVEGGEQGGCAVAFVVVGHRPGAPRLHRQSRLGAVRAWIWLFSSTERTTAWAGGLMYRPTMSLSFAANFGSFDSLNVRMRCGASWWASRMRCTDRKLTPATFASIRPVQCVASPGGGPVTRSMTSCTVSAGSGALPGLRVLSRSKPSTPSAMNRACQVHTTGFALPDRRMISAVPQPSAVARMIWARHTCFCGAQRSETIASSRRRSAQVTLTTIPALMTRA